MPNCRTCGTHIGGGEGHSVWSGSIAWLCKSCYGGQEDRVKSSRKTTLDAFRLGSRQGWDRCIESLKDFSGDGVVTDDMIAWLKKEMLEDSV